MKKVLSGIVNGLCIVAIIVLVGVLVMMGLGLKPAVVISGSMEPTIKTGSLIFIDTKYEDPEENDIVAFRTGGSLVTHRLVKDTEDGWITKGDANDSEDPWRITNEQLLGKTVFWIPVLGYLIGKGEKFRDGKEYTDPAHRSSS
ncbi:MAG: signal peptidase I [Firmicutes bacterium]|nr:signal peptidase I [Bacillota bacterium]